MKKKVAIITTEVNLTGANQSLFDWLKYADRKPYEFVIVFPKYNQDMWRICGELNCEPINGHYFHEYERMGRETLKNIITLGLNHFWMPVVTKRLVKILKERNISIIHSNTYATLLGAYISDEMGIPHVWHIREFMEEDYQITHFRNRRLAEFCNKAHAIYISQIIKEKYDGMFKIGDVLYDQVAYCEGKKNFIEGKPEVFRILMAGTLAENKGQMDAVRAAHQLVKENYPIELLICGDGPDKEKLSNYIIENNLSENIKLLGFVNELTKFRENIHIAYVCSKMEALGRVTVENMYYCNLTIGANSGCTKELISGNRGLPYTYGDVDSLAKTTIFAIENWESMKDIMLSAHKYAVDSFSKPIYTCIYDIYDEVLK